MIGFQGIAKVPTSAATRAATNAKTRVATRAVTREATCEVARSATRVAPQAAVGRAPSQIGLILSPGAASEGEGLLVASRPATRMG